MKFICALLVLGIINIDADEIGEDDTSLGDGSSRLLLQNGGERRGRRGGGRGGGVGIAAGVAGGNVVVAAPLAGNRALARARGRGFVQPFARRRFNRFNNFNRFTPFNRMHNYVTP